MKNTNLPVVKQAAIFHMAAVMGHRGAVVAHEGTTTLTELDTHDADTMRGYLAIMKNGGGTYDATARTLAIETDKVSPSCLVTAIESRGLDWSASAAHTDPVAFRALLKAASPGEDIAAGLTTAFTTAATVTASELMSVPGRAGLNAALRTIDTLTERAHLALDPFLTPREFEAGRAALAAYVDKTVAQQRGEETRRQDAMAARQAIVGKGAAAHRRIPS